MFTYLSRIVFIFLFLSQQAHAQISPLPLKDPEASGFSRAELTALGNRMNDSIPALGSLIVWSKGGMSTRNTFTGTKGKIKKK